LTKNTPLTAEERELISRELAKKSSHRLIAKVLGRHHSVISREIHRNGGDDHYRAMVAEERATTIRRRPKLRKLVASQRLRDFVQYGLAHEWSPEQISAKLVEQYPDDLDTCVSAKTIYQTLFLQARGELRTQLKLALRTGRTRRISPPRTAETRERSRTWSPSATARRRPRTAPCKNSVTWDQGKELAVHEKFTVKTGLRAYFCDPHSPWQRGSNENTNGLLRQYFPKETDLSGYTQAELDAVAT
jgi:IS30 family transposase